MADAHCLRESTPAWRQTCGAIAACHRSGCANLVCVLLRHSLRRRGCPGGYSSMAWSDCRHIARRRGRWTTFRHRCRNVPGIATPFVAGERPSVLERLSRNRGILSARVIWEMRHRARAPAQLANPLRTQPHDCVRLTDCHCCLRANRRRLRRFRARELTPLLAAGKLRERLWPRRSF